LFIGAMSSRSLFFGTPPAQPGSTVEIDNIVLNGLGPCPTPSPIVTFTSTDVSCFDTCDGSAILNVTGGTLPYTYKWSTCDTSSSLPNLCVGTYTVTVSDSTGCDTTLSIQINDSSSLISSTSSTNATCGQCNGTAMAVVTGGATPYTYLWNDSLAQTTQLATGLCAGTYQIMVTDSAGCIDSITVNVNEPLALSLTANSVDASCNAACDGQAMVITTGGTAPYGFLWDDPLAQTNDTATGL